MKWEQGQICARGTAWQGSVPVPAAQYCLLQNSQLATCSRLPLLLPAHTLLRSALRRCTTSLNVGRSPGCCAQQSLHTWWHSGGYWLGLGTLPIEKTVTITITCLKKGKS